MAITIDLGEGKQLTPQEEDQTLFYNRDKNDFFGDEPKTSTKKKPKIKIYPTDNAVLGGDRPGFSLPTNIDFSDESYNDFTPIFGQDMFFDKYRAQLQTKPEAITNFVGQFVIGEFAGGMIEGVGHLFSLPGTAYDKLMGQDAGFAEDEQNPLVIAGRAIKHGMEKAMPLYSENPDENFDFGDLSATLNNAKSIASTLAIFVPGMGFAKGVGAVGKLLQAEQRLAKLAKSGTVMSKAAAKTGKFVDTMFNMQNQYVAAGWMALGQRHIENSMEAIDTYTQMYEYAKKSGASEEESNLVASKAANKAYNWNYINTVFDFVQSLPLAKFAGATAKSGLNVKIAKAHAQSIGKELAKKDIIAIRAKQALTAGYETVTEGAEEIINAISSAEGLRYGKSLLGEKDDEGTTFLGDRLSEYLKDPAVLEQGMWGSVGGAVFSAGGGKLMMNGMNKILYKDYKNPFSDKARLEEIAARTVKVQELAIKLERIKSGINPATGEAFEGSPEEIQRSIDDAVEILQAKSVAELFNNAARHNNLDFLKEQIDSKAFDTIFTDTGKLTTEELTDFRTDFKDKLNKWETELDNSTSRILNIPGLSVEDANILISQSMSSFVDMNMHKKRNEKANKEAEEHRVKNPFFTTDDYKNHVTYFENLAELKALQYTLLTLKAHSKDNPFVAAAATNPKMEKRMKELKQSIDDYEKEMGSGTITNPINNKDAFDTMVRETAVHNVSKYISDLFYEKSQEDYNFKSLEIEKNHKKIQEDIKKKQENIARSFVSDYESKLNNANIDDDVTKLEEEISKIADDNFLSDVDKGKLANKIAERRQAIANLEAAKRAREAASGTSTFTRYREENVDPLIQKIMMNRSPENIREAYEEAIEAVRKQMDALIAADPVGNDTLIKGLEYVVYELEMNMQQQLSKVVVDNEKELTEAEVEESFKTLNDLFKLNESNFNKTFNKDSKKGRVNIKLFYDTIRKLLGKDSDSIIDILDIGVIISNVNLDSEIRTNIFNVLPLTYGYALDKEIVKQSKTQEEVGWLNTYGSVVQYYSDPVYNEARRAANHPTELNIYLDAVIELFTNKLAKDDEGNWMFTGTEEEFEIFKGLTQGTKITLKIDVNHPDFEKNKDNKYAIPVGVYIDGKRIGYINKGQNEELEILKIAYAQWHFGIAYVGLGEDITDMMLEDIGSVNSNGSVNPNTNSIILQKTNQLLKVLYNHDIEGVDADVIDFIQKLINANRPADNQRKLEKDSNGNIPDDIKDSLDHIGRVLFFGQKIDASSFDELKLNPAKIFSSIATWHNKINRDTHNSKGIRDLIDANTAMEIEGEVSYSSTGSVLNDYTLGPLQENGARRIDRVIVENQHGSYDLVHSSPGSRNGSSFLFAVDGKSNSYFGNAFVGDNLRKGLHVLVRGFNQPNGNPGYIPVPVTYGLVGGSVHEKDMSKADMDYNVHMSRYIKKIIDDIIQDIKAGKINEAKAKRALLADYVITTDPFFEIKNDSIVLHTFPNGKKADRGMKVTIYSNTKNVKYANAPTTVDYDTNIMSVINSLQRSVNLVNKNNTLTLAKTKITDFNGDTHDYKEWLIKTGAIVTSTSVILGENGKKLSNVGILGERPFILNIDVPQLSSNLFGRTEQIINKTPISFGDESTISIKDFVKLNNLNDKGYDFLFNFISTLGIKVRKATTAEEAKWDALQVYMAYSDNEQTIIIFERSNEQALQARLLNFVHENIHSIIKSLPDSHRQRIYDDLESVYNQLLEAEKNLDNLDLPYRIDKDIVRSIISYIKDAYTESQSKGKNELEKKSGLEEIITYAFATNNFTTFLNELPDKDYKPKGRGRSKQTLWQKLKNAIAKLFQIKIKNKNLLAKITRILDDIIPEGDIKHLKELRDKERNNRPPSSTIDDIDIDFTRSTDDPGIIQGSIANNDPISNGIYLQQKNEFMEKYRIKDINKFYQYHNAKRIIDSATKNPKYNFLKLEILHFPNGFAKIVIKKNPFAVTPEAKKKEQKQESSTNINTNINISKQLRLDFSRNAIDNNIIESQFEITAEDIKRTDEYSRKICTF